MKYTKKIHFSKISVTYEVRLLMHTFNHKCTHTYSCIDCFITDKYGEKIVNDKYKQNKIDAVFYTNHLLTNIYKNDEVLAIINSNKKKDDLCDAFLMCVYYYENKL